MLNRALNFIMVAVFCVVLGLMGCTPQSELALKPQVEFALKFKQNDSAVYKVITSNSTKFKFEMPSSNKFNEKISNSTDMETTFLQEIESVDEYGVATANITIQSMKVRVIKEGEVIYDYDSSRPTDSKLPLSILVGRGYKISIDPMGDVEVLDASKIRAPIRRGGKIVNLKDLISNAGIKGRHEIITLTSMNKTKAAVGETWSKEETPPFKMLSPKIFEKIYTLDEIRSGDDGDIAIVSMKAIPAGSAISDSPISMMAGMMGSGLSMDSEENYTGEMIFNLQSGIVLSHKQVLEAITVATDTSSKNKAPDILTITQIFMNKAEKIK